MVALRHSIGSDERGAIFAEYLIGSFMFFCVFSLAMQFASLYGEKVVVQAGAASAAAAAGVVIPDCPSPYNVSETMELNFNETHACEDDVDVRALRAIPELNASLPSWLPRPTECRGDEKLGRINAAARSRVMAVSPHPARLFSGEWTYATMGDDMAMRATFGVERYLRGALALTFTESHEGETQITFARNEDIPIRLTYLAYCGTPFVASMLCHTLDQLRPGGSAPAQQRDAFDRLMEYAEYPEVLDGIYPGTRFIVLEVDVMTTAHGKTWDSCQE